jgi:hypothetical protein
MKKLRLFTYCILFLLLACSHTQTQKIMPCPDNGWWKNVHLEVLKVFSARDGDAIYRAYLVKWKNQEIVVSDSLARTDYKKGEIITAIAMAHSYPNDEEDHGLLSFEIVPPEVAEKLKRKNSESGSVGDSQDRATTGN